MRFRKVNAIVLICFAFILFSCRSVPAPNTGENALLVVNSIRTGERAGEIGIADFYLTFEDGSAKRINMGLFDNITLISDFVPGQVKTKYLRVRLGAGTISATGKQYFDYPLRIELTLRAGHYTVFPVIIAYHGEKSSEEKSQVGVDFAMANSKDMRKIEHSLKSMGVHDNWIKLE